MASYENQDWQTSLCDCSPCGSCVLGTFLPSLLVGRATSRLQHPESADAPDMCNGDCAIHAALNIFLFGSGWMLAMGRRGEIRRKFGIAGSGTGDCCTAFWCPCCQVIQADNEVRLRLEQEEARRRGQNRVDVQGYKPGDGMVAKSR